MAGNRRSSTRELPAGPEAQAALENGPGPEELRRAIEVLEAVVSDRAILAQLPNEERTRLLVAAGRTVHPDLQQKRRLVRSLRSAERRRAEARDRAVLAQTGIRSARQAEVFVAPPKALEAGEPQVMRDLQRVFEFAFNGLNRFPGYLQPEPRVIDRPFLLGKTLLTPLPVPHGRSIVNGYLFSRDDEKLVAYLSDCSAVPEEIARQIEDVKVLIIDALRHEPHPTHLSVSQALEVAERVRPQQTWLTHICHQLPQSAETSLPPNTGIAYDGLKLRL
jgi:hypothetical protein